MTIDNEIIKEMFKSLKLKNDMCLAPKHCEEKTVKCHSVQNSSVLDRIEEDGHVYILQQKIFSDKMPTVEFEKYSRNKATTFRGLCNKHDTEIFKPIDIQEIDLESEEHLFLIAYRSVLQELSAQIESALMINNLYMKKIELGKISSNEYSNDSMIAYEFILRAFDCDEYKHYFDQVYLSKNYKRIKHFCFKIDMDYGNLAASAVYSSIELAKQKDMEERIILNVFPNKDKLIVIFSCTDKEYKYVKPHVDEFSITSGIYRKYMLSKLILRNCANFVISPRLYKKFSDEKKTEIKKYFMDILHSDLENYENKNLYLFE